MAPKLKAEGLGLLLRAAGSHWQQASIVSFPKLRQPRPSPSCVCALWSSRRRYATARSQQRIAVLGGGLTGLTTAYYLTRFVPGAHITLYESSDRLGGWIESEEVKVKGKDGQAGTVIFEKGARMVAVQRGTAKWDDLILFELVVWLKLQSELLTVSKEDRSRRYIYYPDRLVDVTSPMLRMSDPLASLSSILSFGYNLLTQPLFKGLPSAVWNMFKSMIEGTGAGLQNRPNRTKAYLRAAEGDVSMGDYWAFKFGSRELVDNMLSALVHGIYGGDVWNLTVQGSMFGDLVARESIGGTGPGVQLVQRGDLLTLWSTTRSNQPVADLGVQSFDWKYMHFKNGFNTLTNAIAAALRSNPNVTIRLNEEVKRVRMHDEQTVEVVSTRSKGEQALRYDRVISTLLAKTLASVTDGLLPSLSTTKAVNIMLVNLWYPTPGLNHPYEGFGYLIPQTVPAENNPELALGVIFDSDRLKRGADGTPLPVGDTVPGTKLTVMLGGHLWDGLPLPSPAEAIVLARAVVARHLGIPLAAEPGAASAKLCRDCIPQHRVGHYRRMAAANRELLRGFGGRLAVAGPSYTAPGVLPALRAGRDVAVEVAGRRNPHHEGVKGEWAEMQEKYGVGETGLRRFVTQMWAPVARRTLPFMNRDTPGGVEVDVVDHRGQGKDRE